MCAGQMVDNLHIGMSSRSITKYTMQDVFHTWWLSVTLVKAITAVVDSLNTVLHAVLYLSKRLVSRILSENFSMPSTNVAYVYKQRLTGLDEWEKRDCLCSLCPQDRSVCSKRASYLPRKSVCFYRLSNDFWMQFGICYVNRN